MSAHNVWDEISEAAITQRIDDPGDAGAMEAGKSGYCGLTSAGAETRTLADPAERGQLLILAMETYVGDVVITAATAINASSNTIMTFGVAGDAILLLSVYNGTQFVWQVLANNGVALS